MDNNNFNQKYTNTMLLFLALSLGVLAFLLSMWGTTQNSRKLPRQSTIIHDRALRGDIISKDGYTLSTSSKTYIATIFTQSINPDKKKLLTKLLSIYTGIDEKEFIKKIETHKGYTVLARHIDANSASRLKLLAYKLRIMKVFIASKASNGADVLYGLDIIESGERRSFPLLGTLSPVLGYTKLTDDGKYRIVNGVKGLEKRYDKLLNSNKNGYLKGKRDVGRTVILNKSSVRKLREDGMNLHLNIPLKLQRRVELMLDDIKRVTNADEIIAGIMESSSGKVVALASSERYNPGFKRKEDRYKLNPKFGEFLYEPGSVIKPITLSIALEHHRITPDTWIDTKGGRLKISKRHTITDDEVFDSQTATDIIVHSSNVGISKIVWRLSGEEFHDGLKKFGLSTLSGLDLSRELKGSIRTAKELSNKANRANQSYGYSMMATFTQLWKAYSSFNNGGVAVTPQIVDYLQDADGKKIFIKPNIKNLTPLSKTNANKMKKILKKVVTDGTGKAALYTGLEIGGKTGTAHIVKNGHYINRYNSSFFGFANDNKGNKYTIGVLAMGLTKHNHHFASQSAVPVFSASVDSLVELGYLKPNLSAIDKEKLITKRKRATKQALKKQKIRAKAIKQKLKQKREEIIKREKKVRKRPIKRYKSNTNTTPINRNDNSMPDLF